MIITYNALAGLAPTPLPLLLQGSLMQMNDALEMQGSDCTGGGGHRREGEEAGPVTTDRESGTKRWDKKVGQRQRDKGQRDRDSERWTEKKWEDRDTQTQREK